MCVLVKVGESIRAQGRARWLGDVYKGQGYIKEGKEKLTIAIGCTGGQHRSVSIAQQLARDLSKKYTVAISHREISRYIRK